MCVGFVVLRLKVVARRARPPEMTVRSVCGFFVILGVADYSKTRNVVWGQCTHVFHMHCLIKWLDQPASKQQCPMDRRPWGT